MSAGPGRLPAGVATDLRGASQLVIDAVTGITGLVEKMHRNIASVSPLVGQGPEGGARGISGLVYRSVRGVTRVVGAGLDKALASLTPMLGDHHSPQRDAVLSAINGMFGDHLAATGNALAIPMQWRQQGSPLTLKAGPGVRARGGKLLVLLHGLCMNDRQWLREGHDHGAGLSADLGYEAVYLYYNTGRHIGSNGRELSMLLEQLVQTWPVPVSDLVIVGHSMGGLVARSACLWVDRHRNHDAPLPAWRPLLSRLVCLGTPHQGAPLERAGNWVDILMGISPYTAPLARLGTVRSAGIKDLRHGDISGDANSDTDTDTGRFIAELPPGVQCYLIAASQQAQAGPRPLGDGLVPVRSALGQHPDRARCLPVPPSQQRVFYGKNHFDLLSSPDVYAQLKTWLADGRSATRRRPMAPSTTAPSSLPERSTGLSRHCRPPAS